VAARPGLCGPSHVQEVKAATMPRGRLPGTVPVEAVKAAAVAKRVRMLADRAAGRKYCPRCDETLSTGQFGSNASAPDGLARYCRACMNSYGRQWRADHAVERCQIKQFGAVRPATGTFDVKCCGGWLENDPVLSWWLVRHEPTCRNRWQVNLAPSRPSHVSLSQAV
jgi:hypothetical protein